MTTPRHYTVSRGVWRSALELDGLFWTEERARSARRAMLKLLYGSSDFSCGWSPRTVQSCVVASFVYVFPGLQ